MRYMKLNRNSGMTTLEACLILPISFMLLLFFFWTAFYYYNESVFTKATEVAALEGARHSELNNEEILNIAAAEFKKEIDNQLIFMRTPDPYITVDLTGVTVEARETFDMSYLLLEKSMKDKAVYQIDVIHSAARLKPSNFLRSITIAGDVKERIEDER